MSCYHPLRLFTVGSHKNKYGKLVNTNVVKSFDVDYVKKSNGTIITEYQEIPCGKCIGCRLEYSRQWANRCLLEMQDHKSSLFLTLTYDDEHLPTAYHSRIDTGETDICSHSLSKRDMQLFIKRLRRYLERNDKPPIRYFICGEYGGQTLRPHYHAIIFGLELDDLVLYKKNSKGFSMFNSKTLDKLWQKGYVVVEECTWETCAYTARYVMKKQFGEAAQEYEYYNLQPPFLLMSRNPGIGRSYYESHSDLFDYDRIFVDGLHNGQHGFSPPRYFKRLERESSPEDAFERMQLASDVSEAISNIKSLMSSQSYIDMLSSEEANVIARTKSLHRDL